jgi:hypothetical protein
MKPPRSSYVTKHMCMLCEMETVVTAKSVLKRPNSTHAFSYLPIEGSSRMLFLCWSGGLSFGFSGFRIKRNRLSVNVSERQSKKCTHDETPMFNTCRVSCHKKPQQIKRFVKVPTRGVWHDPYLCVKRLCPTNAFLEPNTHTLSKTNGVYMEIVCDLPSIVGGCVVQNKTKKDNQKLIEMCRD